MRTLEVYEIFQKLEQTEKRSDRIVLMQQYDGVPAFKDILRGMFDDSLEFQLPEGKPPYTPNRPESVPSSLLKLHKNFGRFVKGGPGSQIPAYKRESQFIQMLESIHPDDAILVLAMVSGKSPIKGLTKKLVQEAFPNLIRK